MNKKSSSGTAFSSGDFVVYPAHGVGKVADISKQKIAGSELELIVVNFDKDKMTLRKLMDSYYKDWAAHNHKNGGCSVKIILRGFQEFMDTELAQITK